MCALTSFSFLKLSSPCLTITLHVYYHPGLYSTLNNASRPSIRTSRQSNVNLERHWSVLTDTHTHLVSPVPHVSGFSLCFHSDDVETKQRDLRVTLVVKAPARRRVDFVVLQLREKPFIVSDRRRGLDE